MTDLTPTDSNPETWRTLATDKTSATFNLVLVGQADMVRGNDLLTIQDASQGREVCGTGAELASIAKAILAHVLGGPVSIVRTDDLAAYVDAYDDLASLAGTMECHCDGFPDAKTCADHRMASPEAEQAVNRSLEA